MGSKIIGLLFLKEPWKPLIVVLMLAERLPQEMHTVGFSFFYCFL